MPDLIRHLYPVILNSIQDPLVIAGSTRNLPTGMPPD